ncbi:MAG: hypothetical protein DWQ09_13815 [Proteobacteria bacterium]|nr:MAG: hypothetical protein DWQ09_13815 [Pseudomonadota bacterium]
MMVFVQRLVRVVRKEAEALFRSIRPLRPDARRSASSLGFGSTEDLVAHFYRRQEPCFMDWTMRSGPVSVRAFHERFPDAAADICGQADALCRGEVELHEYRYHAAGRIRWHFDPVSQEEIPLRYSRYYRFNTHDDFPDGSRDPILLFKLHTHQHLCRLGQAYQLTGEERYIDSLNSQLTEWIHHFPVGHGYPYLIVLNVAQRLISWCIIYVFSRSSRRFRDSMLPLFIDALALQARFLYRSLSVHGPTNNFVLTECVALWMVALLFPEFPEASRWEAKALEVLRRELQKQILPDGTSFEKSTGYQRFVAELLILLVWCDRSSTSQELDTRSGLQGVLSSLLYLSGPDGSMPQLGDVSLERAFWLATGEDMCDIRELLAAGASLLDDPSLKWGAQKAAQTVFWFSGADGLTQFDNVEAHPPSKASRLFPDGGFAALRNSWEEPGLLVVVDCGGVTQPGGGGHGHNDVLSFVLWKGGQPVIVDPGTYTYFSSRRWRNIFRSTASHNVVQVDGAEIATLGPGLFQVSAVHHTIHHWEVNEQFVTFDADHSGYARFAQPVLPRRQMVLLNSNALILRDLIGGEGEHELVWRFHCAPGVSPGVTATGDLHLNLPGGDGMLLLFLQSEKPTWELGSGWFSPRYGEKLAIACPTFTVLTALPVSLALGMVPLAKGEAVDTARTTEIRAALVREMNACIPGTEPISITTSLPDRPLRANEERKMDGRGR